MTARHLMMRYLKVSSTVWCERSAGGTIGPLFFEDEEGATVTVNKINTVV